MPDWAGLNLGQILYGAKLQSNAGVGGYAGYGFGIDWYIKLAYV